MPASGSFRDTGNTLAVRGLNELRKGLKAAGEGAEKDLRRDLKEIGTGVLNRARAAAPVGPRPKRSDTKPLAQSLRIAVNAKGVSVYSGELHAYIQDSGGRVGKGAIVTSGRASHYMTKAVAESKGETNDALERLLDNLERTATA